MNTALQPLEAIEKNQKKSVIYFVIFFNAWQIGLLATFNFSEVMPEPLNLIFNLFILIGSLGWVASSYFMLKANKLLKKHPELCNASNDERSKLLGIKAMAYGFCICIGAAALIFAASFLIDHFGDPEVFVLTGTFVAHLLLIIGLLSAGIAFLILDKE